MFNSDFLSYIEVLNNGLPKSSPKTREFVFDGSFNSKNSIIQYNNEIDFYIQTKKNNLSLNLNKFHQSNLSDDDSFFWGNYISQFTPNNFNQYSNLVDYFSTIPCDIVICQKTNTENDNAFNKLSLVHLVYPNGWSAEDAIGKPFQYFHSDLKNNGKQIIPDTEKFVDFFINSNKTFERVGAYSIRETNSLDLHPDDNHFSLDNDLFIRFERQVIHSVPEKNAFLFFIHTYIVSLSSNPNLFKNAIEKRDKDCYPKKYIENNIEKINSLVYNYL